MSDTVGANGHFGKTSIERLTAEGASFTQAHYGHATTDAHQWVVDLTLGGE